MFPSLPNALTFLRIAAVPVLVALFFSDASWAFGLRLGVFIFACITDYADGYMARTFQQVSRLGRVLDPLADKLLIVVTLVMLVGTHVLQGLSLIPVILIVGREIFISGLREMIADLGGRILDVTWVAKCKTAAQMGSLCFLLLGDPLGIQVGLVALWGAAFLSVISAYTYWKEARHHMMTEDGS